MDELFTKKVGPLPVGAWALLVGGGAVIAFTLNNRSKSETRTVVDQVAVPVGAVAAPDNAPLVMSPVVRINTEGIDALTAALGGNTSAVKGNTGALTGNTAATKSLTSATKSAANVTSKNTSAISGNTSAIKANTSAVKSNTSAVKSAPKPAASKPAPAKKSTSSTKYYTVKPGDNLSKIAKRYTGNANNWRALYNLNKSAIDASAKRRGKRSPYYNHIISGQRFKLPSGW